MALLGMAVDHGDAQENSVIKWSSKGQQFRAKIVNKRFVGPIGNENEVWFHSNGFS